MKNVWAMAENTCCSEATMDHSWQGKVIRYILRADIFMVAHKKSVFDLRWSVVVLAVCAFVSFSLVTLDYFPYGSLALGSIMVLSLVWIYKLSIRKLYLVWYIFGLIFSLMLVVRVNPLLTFFNIIGIIYSLSLLTLQGRHGFSLQEVLFSPLLVLFGLVRSVSRFTLFSGFERITRYLIPGTLSVIVVLVLIPILSAANPFFRKLTDTLIYQPLIQLFEHFTEEVFVWLVRSLLFVVMVWLLPKMLSMAGQIQEKIELGILKIDNNLGNLLVPKIVVAVLLTVFFVTQIQLYMATPQQLAELGYTNSQLTREVFGQLLVVSLIVFALVYFDNVGKKFNRILTWVLLVQIGFLTLIALRSVFEYHRQYGLTFKRLYGYTAVVWMLGMVGIFSYHFRKSTSNWRFLIQSLVLSGVVLVGVNVMNFDRLIFTYAPVMEEKTDRAYLTKLSADAGSFEELYSFYVTKLDTDDFNQPRYNLYRKIDFLQKKYGEGIDWRVFNLSEYNQFTRVKHLDVKLIKPRDAVGVHLPPAEEYPTQEKFPEVRVTITGLEEFFYGRPYAIHPVGQEFWRPSMPSLEENIFVHNLGVGRFRIELEAPTFIETETGAFNRIRTESIEYEITEVDLELGYKAWPLNPMFERSTPEAIGGQRVLVGESICLPHKDTSGPQTLECAYGITAEDGFNYALSMSDTDMQQFQVGESVMVEGLVVPLESISSLQWYVYDIKGVMQVEDLRRN